MPYKEIPNEFEASIANADDLHSTVGDISVKATEAATITARTAAAWVAASFAGGVGAGVSGAGAEATNVILTKTNAFVRSSSLESAHDVIVDAHNTATVAATIISASASISVGGVAGIGASIGASLARNLIGWTTAGARLGADVQAYIQNSSIVDATAVSVTAVSGQTINAKAPPGPTPLARRTPAAPAPGAAPPRPNKTSP